MDTKPVVSLDKIRGMFMGVFLGDALGAPHEFRANAKTPYTGFLEQRAFTISRFHGKKELVPGQVTDDSEMTLALLRTLIKDHGYNKENVILSYLKWANSGGWMMGRNTRELFRGVTTLKGYNNRINKVLALNPNERSQSNGALMRCSPLALLWDNMSVIEDVKITNPNAVCMDCNLIYVTALRLALLGFDGPNIFNQIKSIAQTNEVKSVLFQVEQREIRNIVQNKGWCLHALWCAMVAITSFDNYANAMEWVISSQPGSDTDTNASISGALIGAILGFNAMQDESKTSKNINILLQVDATTSPTSRPLEYNPKDFYTLTEAAHSLTL